MKRQNPATSKKPAPQKKQALTFKPEDSVGYLLRITSRAFQRAFQERIEQDGITIGMWFYLRALWEKDGLTQRELSQCVETMDPSTGSALTKMERQGLIYRSTDKSDRRKRYIFLTDKAKRIREKLIRHAMDLHAFATGELSSQEEGVLRDALMKIRERLKSDPTSRRAQVVWRRPEAISVANVTRATHRAVKSAGRRGRLERSR